MSTLNINLTNVQPTLVSGTNIKTINGTSLLGSGDITTPTVSFGTSGQIPYTNATGDDYDYSGNLVWDNANNGLGINRTPFGGRALDVLGSLRFTNSVGSTFNFNNSSTFIEISTSGGATGLTINDSSNGIFDFKGGSQTWRMLSRGTGNFEIRDQSSGGATRFTIEGTTGTVKVTGSDNTTGVNTLLTSLDGTELFKLLNNGNWESGNLSWDGSILDTTELSVRGASFSRIRLRGVDTSKDVIIRNQISTGILTIQDGLFSTLVGIRPTNNGELVSVANNLTIGVIPQLSPSRLYVVGADNTTGVNTLLTSLDGTELFKVLNNSQFTIGASNITSFAKGIIRFQNASSNYLEINGADSGTNHAIISNRFNQLHIKTNTGAGAPHIALLPATGGNVGIGTTTPTSKLQVVGTDNTTGVNTLLTSLDGTELVKVLNNGVITQTATSGFDAISFKSQYSRRGYLGSDNGQAWLSEGTGGTGSRIEVGNSIAGIRADNRINFFVGGSQKAWWRSQGLSIGINAIPSALLKLGAATSSLASLNITSSAGVAPTSPTVGDMWFDGTNLKFYDGTTTHNII